MNILNCPANEDTVAELFRLLAQPSRLQIVAVLGCGEACVCHLEAALGLRQAYISQQLMVLRDAGLVTTHKDGRNVYYQLANPTILEVIHQASSLLGAEQWDTALSRTEPVPNCPCPHCAEAAGVQTDQAKDICCDGGTKP